MRRLFVAILAGVCFLGYAGGAFCQDYNLTVAVLVNSTNTSGYNTNAASPGEYQRYPERYLEHLQVPYKVFDVSVQSPPADLSSRQLILIGHSGVNLPSQWQTAVISAVAGGTGLVNLDWSVNIGSSSYIQTIFGASGSHAGTPGTSITVPLSVAPGGVNAHYIAAMQKKFLGDPSGDFVYKFHVDQNGSLKTATSTVLTNAGGIVIARIGSDPLIVATTYGSGRAVHFGTLDYLRADRFGFLMGIDDLFWRSLVWAARKPFVLRGYPRLWAVQMDDTDVGWGLRIRDVYDPTFTGTVAPDGTGGPWKLTGFLYTDDLPAGGAERASVTADIRQGLLKVAPHTFGGVTYGNLYWNDGSGALTDTQWSANLTQVLQWKQGNGGNDTIPSLSRSLVAHYWDISDNTGYDLWNSLGFRYITSIQKPGFQDNADVTINGGAERPHARPFWLYEQPPKTVADEDYSLFFADDYPVNSRSGYPSKTFFLFASQLHDPGLNYPRVDAIWPSSSYGFAPADSIAQFERYTWRFWSCLAPVQLFTHDYYNYEWASASDRQQVIVQVSSWLQSLGVRHAFMEELGDYIYSRNKSVLTDVQVSGNNITYTFTGNSATADGTLVNTNALVFFDNASEGVPHSLSGFVGGITYTLQLPQAPPVINSVTPSTGSVTGGTSITINGANFVNVMAVKVGGNPVTNLAVGSSSQITATTPSGVTGSADVVVVTASGMTTLANGFTYLGLPVIDSVTPGFGPQAGGTQVTIIGRGFDATSTVTVGGVPATGVVVTDSATLTAMTPAGVPGPAGVTVTNAQGATTLSGGFFYLSASDTIHMDFKYANRSALLSAGWDFIARTYSGISRNTEQTSGLVVSYDQTAHPGTIRIPVGPGDMWENTNDSQNTLFFNLPDNWNSINLKIVSFSPTADFQQVGLLAYQDDDNYVSVSRYYSSGLSYKQTVEFGIEDSGYYNVTDQRQAPSGAVIYLRLDRDPSTDVISAFSSTDGNTWTSLSGSITKTLVKPRLCILIGANLSGTSPNADLGYVEIVAHNSTPPAPTVTAISPTSGPTAGGTTVQISGTGFIAGSTVKIGTVAATGVVVNSATSISAVTPAGTAGAANVVVTNTNGTGTFSGGFTYVAPIPPTVTGISPASGPTAGGTAVQISGTGFIAGSTVKIGTVAATGVVVNSTTSISAVTPAGTAGAADVVVTNTNGTGTLTGGFTYVASGGTLFSDDFNDGNANGWTISPLGNAAGWSVVGGVYTYNGGGHTQSYTGDATWADYTIQADIELSSLSNWPGGIRGRVNPATGAGYVVWLYPANGQIVLWRATGWNIDSPGLTQLGTAGGIAFDTSNFHTVRITFAGSTITVYYDGALVITAADATYSSGLIALDVSNQPVSFDNVTVISGSPLPPAPTVTGISPTSGPTAGGTAVQITGSGFITGSTVKIGTVAATGVVVNSTTSISAVTPAGTAGAADVVVTNTNGTGTLTGGFTYLAPPSAPTVTGISPTSGPTAGGTAVQISGTGFIAGSTVTIGGASATGVVVNSATSISAVTPAGTAGAANVVVTNTNGTGTFSGGFVYVAPIPPTVTGISPASGPTGGGTAVQISGTGFITGSTVTIGGASATGVVVNSATSISAVTPAGTAGAADVVVTNTNGTGTLTGGFTYVASGGTLFSDDFNDGNANGWTISPLGNAAGWSVVGGVYTYNGGGHTQSYTGDATWADYTIQADIELSSLSNWPGGIRGRVNPDTGAGYAVWLYPANGQIVLWRATGWNIDSPGLTQLGTAGGIAFDTSNFHTVRITFAGSTITVYYDGALVITAADATYSSGLIDLDVSNQPVSFDNVTVISGSPLPPAPTVTGISPTSGPTAGGTAVQISGTGFIAGSTVKIGTVAATGVVVNSTTSISAVTPAGTAGAADVVVTNTNGTGTLTGGFTYLAPPSAPTVSSISPASGPTGGGTAVQITGSGFITGSTVTIGGASATGVVVNSATSISAVTPAGTAGAANVVVTNTNGTGTLTGGFTYLAPPSAPTVSSISPASGPTGGGTAVQITGSGFITGSTVTIGGASATGVVVNSATSISAVTPAGTAGAANVAVTNTNGSGILTGGFTYSANSSTAVKALDSWKNLYSASPNNARASNLNAGSFAVGSGSQRLLLVSVIMEIGTAANPTISAKYGGTTLTQIGITANTQREIVWVGYLKDAQIGSGSKALTISYSGASGNVSALHVKWASYAGVNQGNPVASSAAHNTGSTSVTFGSTINYVNGGVTIVVAGNGGTPATGTLTATPSFSAGTATTTNAQTSRTFATATHTAAGSYSSSTAVTWSGTTSPRSGLVVVSMQP